MPKNAAPRWSRFPGWALIALSLEACAEPGEGALRKGNAAAAAGDLPVAVLAFTEAAQAAPKSAHARELLGNALFASGKQEGAEAAWAEALELDPEAKLARLGLARAELQRGNHAAALAHLDGIRAPWADEKTLRAVVLLARGGQGDAQGAQEAARKALELSPESKEALFAAGCAALSLRDDAGAQRIFDRLLQKHEGSELGPLGLARLAAVKGQRTDVLLYLRATRKAMGPRWNAQKVLADPAFRFLDGDAELAREVGEP